MCTLAKSNRLRRLNPSNRLTRALAYLYNFYNFCFARFFLCASEGTMPWSYKVRLCSSNNESSIPDCICSNPSFKLSLSNLIIGIALNSINGLLLSKRLSFRFHFSFENRKVSEGEVQKIRGLEQHIHFLENTCATVRILKYVPIYNRDVGSKIYSAFSSFFCAGQVCAIFVKHFGSTFSNVEADGINSRWLKKTEQHHGFRSVSYDLL